jgi:hypothetical protein
MTVRRPHVKPSERRRSWGRGITSVEGMTIQRLENVGIVVDDLAAATEFFVELGLTVLGEGPVGSDWVDRVVGLDGVSVDIAMLQTRTAMDGWN